MKVGMKVLFEGKIWDVTAIDKEKNSFNPERPKYRRARLVSDEVLWIDIYQNEYEVVES
jgi:hypothetical protein